MSTHRNRLGTAIKNAAADQGLSIAALARKAGLAEKTLRRNINGESRMHHVTKRRVEQALGWPPGQIDHYLTGTEPDHQETPHGTLTWVENPDGTRDYRLTKTINGVVRGVTISGTHLKPDDALEDLQSAMAILTAAYHLRDS